MSWYKRNILGHSFGTNSDGDVVHHKSGTTFSKKEHEVDKFGGLRHKEFIHGKYY